MNFENPIIQSYRELLRVERDPSPDTLRRAYRAMAMVYHPDRNRDPNAAAVFIRIKEAYRVLQDPRTVDALNRQYAARRRSEQCIRGLDLEMGSFFGHRFRETVKRTADPSDLPWGEDRPRLEIDQFGNSAYETGRESEISILDDPSLDLVEVIFAGRFDLEDEEALAAAFRKHDYSSLPWFVLNNEGIVHFLNGNYEGALRCYQELNERIPDNIIFLYRLGICHEIMAYQQRHVSILRGAVLDRDHLNTALACYERAIRLGENRPYLPQDCMTIRKTRADLLEVAGRRWRAHRAWQQIQEIRPQSREANQKLNTTRPRIVALLGPASES